jgi:predicted aspartyl protease
MRKYIAVILLLLFSIVSHSQSGFKFPDGVDQVTVPFKSAYNLIVLPVLVNGVELDFILDTGASRSIIFNFNSIDSLQVTKGDIIKVSGYGDDQLFDAYYSPNNRISVGGYGSQQENILVTTDRQINLLPFLGIDVHGLLGSSFFQDAVVELDYISSNVHIYRNASQVVRLRRSMSKFPIKFANGKPYMPIKVENDKTTFMDSMLVDTGSSDALWLQSTPDDFKLPYNGFEDYLGFGINGKVFGRRSKLDNLQLGLYALNDVTVSLPASSETSTVLSNNSNSIGGEVLSRFKVVLDYRNKYLYLSPNEEYTSGFFYNMAGIDIKAGEKELFTYIDDKRTKDTQGNYGTIRGQKRIDMSTTYNYVYAPKLFIEYVRPDSPAEKAGVRAGDQIIKFNNRAQSRLTLNNVASKFFKNPYSKIKMRVKRGDAVKKISFQLKPVIE